MKPWLPALVLGASTIAWGCKFPAFEGKDICSGLVVGDLLEIHLQKVEPETPAFPCEPGLGIEVGDILSSSIRVAGDDGCGKTTGPVNLEGQGISSLEFDEVRSSDFGDSRTNPWVSVNDLSEGECKGEVSFELYGVEPEVVDRASSGKLAVSYVPRSGSATCRQACRLKFGVSLTKAF
jgi:hypothetical protein